MGNPGLMPIARALAAFAGGSTARQRSARCEAGLSIAHSDFGLYFLRHLLEASLIPPSPRIRSLMFIVDEEPDTETLRRKNRVSP